MIYHRHRRRAVRSPMFGKTPFIDACQMIILRESRPDGGIGAAGIGRVRRIKLRCQPCQHAEIIIRRPVIGAHLDTLRRLAALAGQPPIFHRFDQSAVQTVEPATRGNDRLHQKLRTPPFGDSRLCRRLACLVIENRVAAVLQPVDPVSAGGEGDRAGRCLNLDPSLDLGMAVQNVGAAARLGFDKPGGDGLEGRPPEMPHSRVLPIRFKQATCDGAEPGQRIVRKVAGGVILQKGSKRVMHQIATKRGIDRPVKIVLWSKLQNTLGIEAVGIGNPVINLGGREPARARRHRRRRPRPRHRRHHRHRRHRCHRVPPLLPPVNRPVDAERGSHRIEPLPPAACRGRGITIAKRTGDDHFRGAACHPDVMRAEPGAPVMGLQPGSAPHLGIGPGIDLRPRRPVALIEAAKDQPVSTLHPRLDRAKDGQARVGLPDPPDGAGRQKLCHDMRKGFDVGGKAIALLG